MSACIRTPWATYSKQLTGHEFHTVCAGKWLAGSVSILPPPPLGADRHLATVPPGVEGDRRPWEGGWTWGGGEGKRGLGHIVGIHFPSA